MTTTSPTDSPALSHTALLYRDADSLRTATAAFLGDAVTAGQPVLAVLPAQSTAVLHDILSRASELTHLDAGDAARNPGRLIPTVLAWQAGHGRPGRVLSEALWPGRTDAETAECLRHEALVNVSLAVEPLTLLCPFDAAGLDDEALAGARMTHPRVIDEAGERTSDRYGDPLELARGENWPQTEPTPPISGLHFEGDLWALRHSLAEDELLSDLDPERREALVFAVNETASNALHHGDGTCRARVWCEADRIVSEITTSTRIEDPLAGRRPPDARAPGGRGLWLVNQLCDLVEVRSGPEGTSVRMHMERSGGGDRVAGAP